MDYYKKYLKYKNKYKKLIGGMKQNTILDSLNLGIKYEMDKYMQTGLYKDINMDSNTNILTLTRINDNALISIKYNEDFPYSPPIIKINNIKKRFLWDLTKNSYDVINDETFNKNVLILCHPHIVTGTFEPSLTIHNHWLGMVSQDLFKEYKLKGTPFFETVDSKKGGTYQMDAFSDDFIKEHENDYDLVMIPDCDGSWAQCQKNQNYENMTNWLIQMGRPEFNFTDEEKIKNEEKFMLSALKLTKMVKMNGIIHYSKFLKEEFANKLCEILNKNNFKSKLIKLQSIQSIHIIAQKSENSSIPMII
jgi:hypothetical protein